MKKFALGMLLALSATAFQAGIAMAAEKVTINLEGKKTVEMEYKAKDGIYQGKFVLPAGKKAYTFNIKSDDKSITSTKINFNEIANDYAINFVYNPKTNTVSTDYMDKVNNLDGRVVEKSLYFNSRDLKYRTPFGAIVQGTKVTFTLAAKANDLEKARLVIGVQKGIGTVGIAEYVDKLKYPMKKAGYSKDGAFEYWTVSVDFKNINVYGYYFEAIDGKDIAIYQNNMFDVSPGVTRVVGTGGAGKAVRFVPERFGEEDINPYRITVYDASFKVPDWAKDVVYYYIFPDRFKNGDKSNDPKVGVKKFYGNTDIEFHQNWVDGGPYKPGEDDGTTADDNVDCNDFYGGDIAGLIQKLDYIKDLGANTIYLNPIFQSPSNHRYDVADYRKIDDAFGTNEEFKKLVKEIKKRGLRIVLDASFNHTASDSSYMDKFGKYPTLGAYENQQFTKDSPFYDWYELNEPKPKSDDDEEKIDGEDEITPDPYNFWGNDGLANLKESDGVKDFIYRDKDSITKYWLDMGIDGWRMDVAPWVSDQFWREWRREVKSRKPEPLTVCETWFDSSKYFLGDTFDSTMNYVFRQVALEYADGKDAKMAVEGLEMMRENYPADAFYSSMTLLSTHDVVRSLFYFGYIDGRSNDADLKLAKQKLLLALFLQMTYPGAPAIYYGDEVGVYGGEDPFNRRTYPWKEDGGHPDENMLKQFKQLTKLRNDNAILRRGSVEIAYNDSNVIVMLRKYKGQTAVIAVNNAKETKSIKLNLKALGGKKVLYDLLNNKQKYTVDNGVLELQVPALFGKVLLTK